MSAAAQGLQPLRVVDGVAFAIGRTQEPWTLPIDMLTISVGRSGGLGTLGKAVQAAMPGLAWDRIDFGRLSPNHPQLLTVPDSKDPGAASRLRGIAVATVRDRPTESGFDRRATVRAVSVATSSVIDLARGERVAALGVPLLGSAVGGLPVDEVAEEVVRVALDEAPQVRKIDLVVFVCRDDDGERAIRAAWERRMSRPGGVQRYADVLSDAESAEDRLGITADVNAVAALLAATTTTPPLSVALLGNWGSGKSTFMNLVHQRVAALSEHAAGDLTSRFSPVIRQARFNAWHYSDDHVWVGLIEHLFRVLREVDKPAPAPDGEVTRLEDELDAARNRKALLDDELERINKVGRGRGWWGWLWEPRRLVLIVRAAWRQAFYGLSWRSALTGVFGALAAGALVIGVVLGSPLIAWLAALPLVAPLVPPAVSMWRQIHEMAGATQEKLDDDQTRMAAKIAELQAQLARADAVRGLKALVDELNSGDRYKPFRGLTGQIHQDLARLDDQMGKLADPRQRQRIILYVDDLDRCTSDRVVHVLQTVNLLLSMPLFVVVVAVDPRWLLNALEEHYGKPLDGRVRALDYLDKIFHVPFAIRPMHDRAGDYLRSLLPAVDLEETEEPVPPVEPVALTGELRGVLPVPETKPEGTVSVDVGQQLRIRQVEADFLPRVAALLDTPRAVKKAVNLYLLLRATIPDSDLDDYLGDEHGGPFQAAALLIAGVVSCPAEASDLLDRVMLAKPDEPIGPVLRNEATPVCVRLAEAIDGLGAELPFLGEVSAYQRWARTVARYSFESYALFGVEPNHRPR